MIETDTSVSRALKSLANRQRNMILRGSVALVDDSRKLQTLQVSLFGVGDDTPDDIERFQQYGFTSKPFTQSEAIVLFPGGDRSHGLCLAVGDRRYRLTGLADGEVALYDDQNQVVHIRRDGIYIISAEQVVIDSPQAVFTGDMAIDGELYVQGDISSDGNISDGSGSMQEMRDTYNAHIHPGVQSGGGSTGPTSSSMS